MQKDYWITDRNGRRRRPRPGGEPIADGEAIEVRLDMMDAAQRALALSFPATLHDAFGNAAGYRPGFVFSPPAASVQARDAAWEHQGRVLADAWRHPEPVRQADAAAAAPRARSPAHVPTRDNAWERLGADQRAAWRGAA